MEQSEIMQKLQEPFHQDDIEWRVGATNKDKNKGLALAYVTNRAMMNRLDDVFGPFGWQNEYREWKKDGMKGSQLCGISIKYEGEWITKWDGADDSDTEAIKGGLSDAMKRAGYQWGIGRYLYNLESTWVPIKGFGNSYAIDGKPPKLPSWALPRGQSGSTGTAGSSAAPPTVKPNPPASAKAESPKVDEETITAELKELKVAYMVYKGDMDGFDEWCRGMLEKKSAAEILTFLQSATIKKLYQEFTGSLDGMEAYVEKQKKKGWADSKIIELLKGAVDNKTK